MDGHRLFGTSGDILGDKQIVVLLAAIHKVAPSLYHALVHQLLERLLLHAHANVEEELVPETGIDKVSRAMLGAAHVEVYVLPILHRLFAEIGFVVAGVHIAQIISARACKARHGAQLQGEYGLVVNLRGLHHLAVLLVPCPHRGVSQWGLACGGRLEVLHLGQQQRQALFGYGVGSVILVVDGERLAPVALAAEDGVAQTVVHRAAADTHLLYLVDDGCHRILHLHAGHKAAVHAVARLSVHALLPCGGVAELVWVEGHHLSDGQVEMACKGKVAAVVCRHSHDGTRAVACQHIVAHPDGYALARQGVHGKGSGEYAAHLLHLCLAFALRAVLRPSHVGLHLGTLLRSGNLLYHLMFGAEHHKRHAEDSVGTCGENLKRGLLVGLYLTHQYLLGACSLALGKREPHRRAFAASYPVALYLLQAVGPLHFVQSVHQSLGVGGDAEAPLAHQFALHGVAAAHA